VKPENLFVTSTSSIDVWSLSRETVTATPFLEGPGNQMSAQFSPAGGGLVAYSSDHSGRPEIYVTSKTSGSGTV
jgi:hypothetical protein